MATSTKKAATVAKKKAVPATKKTVTKKSVAAKKPPIRKAATAVKKATTVTKKAVPAVLPKQFAKLAKYMEYALPTTKERLRKRAGTPMPTLEAFYNFMKPCMIEILTFLQAHPVSADEQTPEVRNLVYLAKSFMEASMAVELLHEPDESNVWGFEDLTLADR